MSPSAACWTCSTTASRCARSRPALTCERDVLAQAEIPLHVAPNLKLMDAALFRAAPLGLNLPEKRHG